MTLPVLFAPWCEANVLVTRCYGPVAPWLVPSVSNAVTQGSITSASPVPNCAATGSFLV